MATFEELSVAIIADSEILYARSEDITLYRHEAQEILMNDLGST